MAVDICWLHLYLFSTRYKGEMYYQRGSAKNAFTAEEVNEKFMSLALPIMEKKSAVQISQVIDSLETVKDINELTNLLA